MRPIENPMTPFTHQPQSQHAAMRRGNEHTILERLRREPNLSGSAIAKKTGLAPQTVSVLLRHLEATGLIARGAVLRGRRGQPAIPFHLRGEAAYAIGVEVSWHHCEFVLVDLAGQVISGQKIVYLYPDPDRIVDQVAAGIADLHLRMPSRTGTILGIGLTGPATLDTHIGIIGAPDEVRQRLSDIDLRAELMKRTELPISESYDGTSALWSETGFGRMQDGVDCGYVFLSIFIGSALCVDGHILVGRGAGSARIGASMTNQPNGSVSALYRTCSPWALANFLIARGHDIPAHDIAAWDWDAIETDFAIWLDTAASALALAFANTTAIVGVPTIVLDGILPRKILARMVNAIQTKISALPIRLFEPPLILLGESGASAPAMGAAFKLLHDHYFDC